MEVVRGAYYHRPGPGMKLVRLGRTRQEANLALAAWRRERAAEKLAAIDPWLKVERNLYTSMRKRCRDRGWEPLAKADMEALWARAAGHCEVTGIRFSLDRRDRDLRRPWAPSLDRRDCALPYTFDNCRLVCTAVNIAMNEWGEEALLRIAKALSGRSQSDDS